MNKISDAFKNNNALITYLMAGDPDLKTSAEYILTAQDAGADLIEIGIPFSDPIAEGKVIQEASIRALKSETRLEGIFDMVASIANNIKVPLVFMTYLNPVFVYGYDRFFSRCAEIGISGVIIPDLPSEEQEEAKNTARKYKINIITIVAPTSQNRISEILKNAEGFVYLVSSMGVTGIRRKITTDLTSIISDIRCVTNIPVAIGFGISTPNQAEYFLSLADGVIVGSAIVQIIGKHGRNARNALYEYISAMHEKTEAGIQK